MTVVMAMKKKSYKQCVRTKFVSEELKDYLLDAVLAELGLQDLVDNHELVVTLSESSATAENISSVAPHEQTMEVSHLPTGTLVMLILMRSRKRVKKETSACLVTTWQQCSSFEVHPLPPMTV